MTERTFAHFTIQVSYKPALYASVDLELYYEPEIKFKDGSIQEPHIVISDRHNRFILPHGHHALNAKEDLQYACERILEWLKTLP